MKKVGCVVVFIILMILITSSVSIQNSKILSRGDSLTRGDEYTEHVRIKIEGNGDFDFAHGVVGGSGTYTDPYIIKGWKINANRTDYGILIENTSAYVVIEDCYIYNTSHSTGNSAGSGFWDFYDDGGIKLIRASNILIKNVVLKDGNSGIFIWGGENIWVKKLRFDSYLLWASIYVNSSRRVTVEDNTFNLHSGEIVIRNSQYLTVEKNVFKMGGDDISVKNARYLRVSNNKILGEKKGSFTGIDVATSQDVVLENNTIVDMGTAIRVASSPNSKIVNNTMVNCSIVVGGNLSDISTYDLHGNTVNGRDVVFIKNRSNFTFSGEAGEIILANVSNFKIAHASVSRASWAIEIVHGNNGTVENSELRHNLNSILITSSENITVADDTLEYGAQAIAVSSSKFIIVEGNIIRHFESAGLSIGTSTFVWVQNNEIYDSWYAISIGGTGRFLNKNIYVLNNTCYANYYGLYLTDSSSVVVMRNNFNKNSESGISIDGIMISNSKISGNICNDNGLYGIDVSGWLVDSEITNNTLIGNAEGLHIPDWATPENCTISGNRIVNRMPSMYYYVLLVIGVAAILVVLFFVRHHRRKS